MTPKNSITISGIPFQLEGDLGKFTPSLSCETLEQDLHLLHITLSADTPFTPKPIKLSWQYPIADIQSAWHPAPTTKRSLTLPWEISVKSKATEQAPVVCLHNLSGKNRLTFACSDALNHIESTASIHEPSANFSCHAHFFVQPVAPLSQYKTTLRIDLRDLPYYEALNQTQNWWATLPGITPSPVPDIARWPMYSTWYSFHQDMTDKAVEHQCKLAKEFGCDSVIIDDGWQTEDNGGGYAYCGDWEVTPKKFPSMTDHVARIHTFGMKCLVWFSVPFIGTKSRAYSRFAGKYLCEIERLQASVLDPRFPEVREYLISLYEKYLVEWKIDGFKLDFVDSFAPTAENYNDGVQGRDIESVPEAVDRLLRETMQRLRKINPDIMIEFRQNYVGPLMRNYGNLFRAADCPNDAITNRTRTLDIRLLAGNTAVHSDMLMWSCKETPENAALQFLNILFSVPQISVKLDEIPAEHQKMLRFWIGFWRQHRETLLDGTLVPSYPEQQFPFVLAKGKQNWIGVHYADVVAPITDELPDHSYFVNATQKTRLVIEITKNSGTYEITHHNVFGEKTGTLRATLSEGIHNFNVAPSGFLYLKKVC